eukprot:scaffold17703_cov119-Isochrysis_galbana.AAC.5
MNRCHGPRSASDASRSSATAHLQLQITFSAIPHLQIPPGSDRRRAPTAPQRPPRGVRRNIRPAEQLDEIGPGREEEQAARRRAAVGHRAEHRPDDQVCSCRVSSHRHPAGSVEADQLLQQHRERQQLRREARLRRTGKVGEKDRRSRAPHQLEADHGGIRLGVSEDKRTSVKKQDHPSS